MKTYLHSFFLLLFIASLNMAQAEPCKEDVNWVIDLQAKTIGGLSFQSSERQIVQHFGKKNTESTIKTFFKGRRLLATVVYPGTDNELTFFWKDEARTQCFEILISNESDRWKTAEGIKVGTTLSELNRANGNPFEYAGFDWTYGGTVSNWQGGELPNWFKPVLVSANEKFAIDHRGRRFFQSDESPQAENQMMIESFRLVVGWENRREISSLDNE